MTTIYFVRHAQPDPSGGYNPEFQLTEQGFADAKLVTGVLMDKDISAVYSSSYIRAVQTVRDFADSSGLAIQTTPDLRERDAGKWQGSYESYAGFISAQMNDYDIKADDGESMNDVQRRSVAAIERILAAHEGESVAAATHGMALASILSHYFPNFTERDFNKFVNLMPFVLRIDFENGAAEDFWIELAICRRYPNSYL